MSFYKQRPVLEIECLMTALSWISVVATKTQSLQGIPLPSMFSNLEEIFPDNKFMNASESISFSLFKIVFTLYVFYVKNFASDFRVRKN